MRLSGPDEIVVRSCPGGPDLVRGATLVVDDDGVQHEVSRPVVAICRCDRSQRMPWCDSTHKAVRPR
ncbi:CDGSH iron-sulfur domain-containing protein [Nocardioides aurantiacus]|uniref:CDGSH iron-sulfur domain-containing protein n=1 Tax=Nocardioides aurantiacus TaxID=86796 RepID=UPI00403F5CCC